MDFKLVVTLKNENSCEGCPLLYPSGPQVYECMANREYVGDKNRNSIECPLIVEEFTG